LPALELGRGGTPVEIQVLKLAKSSLPSPNIAVNQTKATTFLLKGRFGRTSLESYWKN
jgi:hypothetical protein